MNKPSHIRTFICVLFQKTDYWTSNWGGGREGARVDSLPVSQRIKPAAFCTVTQKGSINRREPGNESLKRLDALEFDKKQRICRVDNRFFKTCLVVSRTWPQVLWHTQRECGSSIVVVVINLFLIRSKKPIVLWLTAVIGTSSG